MLVTALALAGALLVLARQQGRSSRSSARPRSSVTAGTPTRASTQRSPRPSPPSRGTPRLRRRKRWPFCVPAGTSIVTGPSGVATSTWPPIAASIIPTRTEQRGRRPPAGTAGCGSTSTVSTKSPGGPPRRPALPAPGSRTWLPSPTPGRDLHVEPLARDRAALAAAARAADAPDLARAAALAAGAREDHVPAAAADRARALAARAAHGTEGDVAAAAAVVAGLEAHQVDAAARARHRLVEAEPRRLLEVLALERRLGRGRAQRLVEDLAEADRLDAHAGREVEALEAAVGQRRDRRHRQLAAVVGRALLRVREDLERRCGLAVALGGHGVARVERRVQGARQALPGPPDLGGARPALHPERLVQLHARPRLLLVDHLGVDHVAVRPAAGRRVPARRDRPLPPPAAPAALWR